MQFHICWSQYNKQTAMQICHPSSLQKHYPTWPLCIMHSDRNPTNHNVVVACVVVAKQNTQLCLRWGHRYAFYVRRFSVSSSGAAFTSFPCKCYVNESWMSRMEAPVDNNVSPQRPWKQARNTKAQPCQNRQPRVFLFVPMSTA